MNMNRRQFLASTALTLVGGALVACTQTQLNAGVAKAAADVTLISDTFITIVPQLATIEGVTPAVQAKVTNAVTQLEGLAKQLTVVSTATQAQPLMLQVESDVNTVVTTLATLPIPGPIGTQLKAAAVLLPLAELAIGLVTNTGKAMSAAGGGMSPAEARRVLQAAVAKHAAR